MDPAIKLMDSSADLLPWNANPDFDGDEYSEGYIKALADVL